MITLYDWIMRASAKGVLMMPEDCLPDGVSIDDIAESWTEFNGVIVYKPSKSGKVPEQVANNSTNIGIAELLNMQLKFFEDISGVTGALQGKPGIPVKVHRTITNRQKTPRSHCSTCLNASVVL